MREIALKLHRFPSLINRYTMDNTMAFIFTIWSCEMAVAPAVAIP